MHWYKISTFGEKNERRGWTSQNGPCLTAVSAKENILHYSWMFCISNFQNLLVQKCILFKWLVTTQYQNKFNKKCLSLLYTFTLPLYISGFLQVFWNFSGWVYLVYETDESRKVENIVESVVTWGPQNAYFGNLMISKVSNNCECIM